MTASQPVGGELAEPDGPALLQAAAQAGAEVSDRMLETFRTQGLLPRPRRAGYRGRAPQWRYPPATDRQLIALLRWRQVTKDPDVLKVLLWLDGFAVPAAAVRDALADQLRMMIETMEREISRQAQRLGLDPADHSARNEAINALAHTVAAKRGTTPVPRRSRVRASERTHAIALMIRMFGLGDTIEGTAEEAATVERVLGITPNGRRHAIADTGPWLTGPAEDLFDAANFVGLPHLLAAVTNASDAELTAARQTVIALFRHLPLMVRMIGALFDDDNYTGLASMSQMDQNPEFVVYIVPIVIAMLRAGWKDNLEAITSALSQAPGLAAQARHILDMPAPEVEANMMGQPPEVHERAHRIIEAALEGHFDADTEPPAGAR